MNLPIPIFFIWFLIAIFIFRHHMRKNSKAQEEVSKAFWKKEEDSLVVRKKALKPEDYLRPGLTPEDIGDADYYQSIGLPDLTRQATYLKALITQPMVNFSDTTNTDLRLTYGTASLTSIREYEETYNAYVGTLYKMAKGLSAADQEDMAIKLLEEGLHMGTNNRKHYLLLAECYKKQGHTGALIKLKEKAATLHTLTKDALLKELDDLMK